MPVYLDVIAPDFLPKRGEFIFQERRNWFLTSIRHRAANGYGFKIRWGEMYVAISRVTSVHESYAKCSRCDLHYPHYHREELMNVPSLEDKRSLRCIENQEVLAGIIKKMGARKYTEIMGLVPEQKDEAGELYNAGVTKAVKVKNSTPEPDGTFKDYFLTVPREMKTAKQAVAWTFQLAEKDYQPLLES